MKVKMRFAMLMLVFVVEAVQASFRCCFAETARQVMVFRAIVEFDIPAHRNEEHHPSHQHGPDLQQSFFHAAKIGKILQAQPHN